MKAIKTTRSGAGRALSGAEIVLADYGPKGPTKGIYLLTLSQEVALRVGREKPSWKHTKGMNHAFATDEEDIEKAAAMLAGMFPEIEAWETR